MNQMKRKRNLQTPPLPLLEKELRRERYKYRYAGVLRSTINTLIIIAAFAILVATLWMPVLQIYGTSMNPTLAEGQIVVCTRESAFERGDIIAFYVGNNLLVKRVIAGPGDQISIAQDGTVYVNSIPLDEPYISEKSFGECDLEFPFQVPESRYFLMGDQRKTSVDSRATIVGCVGEEQIVGKIVFSVWPFESFGTVE
jgi:signal peptidase I